jgi:hypothetical protein
MLKGVLANHFQVTELIVSFKLIFVFNCFFHFAADYGGLKAHQSRHGFAAMGPTNAEGAQEQEPIRRFRDLVNMLTALSVIFYAGANIYIYMDYLR